MILVLNVVAAYAVISVTLTVVSWFLPETENE
jgi:hypothetical protein